MDIQLLLVPYDSGQRGWRCGAGPEHLVRAGLPAHLQRQGHIATAIHIIKDDPTYPPAEIRTAFELAWRLDATVRSARTAGHFSLVLSGNCNTAVGTLNPNGLSLRHLTAAIAAVRARVPLGAAALTSYSPEDDHDQGVCRAAFAAIDAIVANGT